jgi:tRNA dimethylallyltransferase
VHLPAPLICIAGPTASGKSAAALALAERTGGEIVSCDSVAVYRGFDVGAAKPTREERARVPHHLIDVADPDERFSAARWVELAERALAEIAARGRPAIVCGGTGLYLRALLEGLFPSPPPDPALRAAIKEEARARGWPALHAQLARVDPVAAARIAPNDRVRIERALEVFRQTGQPLSELQARHRESQACRAAEVVIVDPPANALEQHIAARTRRMLDGGLVEETRALVARWGRGLKPLGALGYKEALAHLDGHLSREALPETIRVATRRFARRQRTWLRDQPGRRVADADEAVRALTEEAT